MSAIYYKGQKYTGPTLNLGSGSLTTNDKTIVGGINEINSSIDVLNTALEDKQNTLVSGTNIKTINNESILGSGNISINVSIPNNITGSGTSGYLTKFNGTNTITEGPALGSGTTTFLRNDGSWAAPSSNALSDISLTWSSSVSTTDWFLAHDKATTDKVLFRAMSPTNVRTTIGAAAASVVGTGTLNTTNKNCIAAINELNSSLGSVNLVKVDKIVLKPTGVTSKELVPTITSLKGAFKYQLPGSTIYWYSSDVIINGSNLRAEDHSGHDYDYGVIVPVSSSTRVLDIRSTSPNYFLGNTDTSYFKYGNMYMKSGSNYYESLLFCPNFQPIIGDEYGYATIRVSTSQTKTYNQYVLFAGYRTGSNYLATDPLVLKYNSSYSGTTIYGRSDTEIAVYIYYV